MERRRLQLANSHDSGGGTSLEFPIYLNTKEGGGDNRTRDADELSLKIVEWYFENCIKVDDYTTQITLSDDEIIYVDEFRITSLGYLINESYIGLFWNNMGSFWWAILGIDGKIIIEYMD